MSTRRGYTLIEVMTAVVVMTIGAAGILAMQGASVHANQDANETSTAINFATTWVERIKRDARLWTAPGNASLGQTRYLNMVVTKPDVWFTPRIDAMETAAADYQGFDTSTASNVRFCVNLKLTVVHAYDPGSGTAETNAVRADVRVWWPRASLDADRSVATCKLSFDENTPLAAALPSIPQIRRHYLSTVVSWRAPGWP